jgi:hypothetical protein
MKKIFVELNGSNAVESWGSSSFSTRCVEIDLEEDHPFFEDNSPATWEMVEGDLVKKDSLVLDHIKRDKDMELNQACEKAILAGFKHTLIDGTTYHFSYDTQAQVNFGDTKEILKEGLVESVPWTVKDMDGNYQRIDLDKAEMTRLSLTILQHKTGNIAKYRDELLPRVMEATTLEEIESIVWE